MMLTAGSCQQELNPMTAGDATVTFTVSAGDIATKAIADATNIDVLHWEIYKTADITNLDLPALGKDSVLDNDGDKNFTVELKLLADQEYSIVFWAEVDGADHYNTLDLRNIQIKDYSDEKANDESRAAFFAVYDFSTENGVSINETVTLYRPFAQINLGATTYETSFNNVEGGLVVESTGMTVADVATSFNTLTGMGEGNQTVTFEATATPNGTSPDKKLEVENNKYYWLGMNYLIVNGEKANVNVDVVLNTNLGQVKHNITNVPVQENYRTNLLGDFLTTGATFNIVIDEEFNTPSEDLYPIVVSSAADLQTAIAATPDDLTGHIQLNGDINLSDILTRAANDQMVTIPAGKSIAIDLNGYSISATDETEKNYSVIDNRGTLTISNSKSATSVSKITAKATINSGWNRYSAVLANNPGGKLTVEEGVVLEHLGGTDMAYGIDNLTNGKGTSAVTVIDGATVKSPYRAVRQFLNGPQATNELYVKAGSVLEGANKSIFFHDPSTGANTGKLVVEAGAQLKGDVYLFVTAGSTEWPVDVTIAQSALVDGSQVVTGNVPAGYTVTTVDGNWVVLDGVIVQTADELIAALEAKHNVIFANDIKIEPASMSNAYGATGINVKNGQTIDGNGYTLNIKGAGGTWDSGINTTGGLIKNLTVTGSFRGIFINHTSTYSEKVVLENVTVGGNGTVYTISCDQGLYQGIEATNCTFNGWTSFAKTAGEAKFVNCSFGEGSGYKYCRPYSNTEFVGCTFCPGYAVDTTRATVTFTDCTWE